LKKSELRQIIKEEIINEMAIEDFKKSFLEVSIETKVKILNNLKNTSELFKDTEFGIELKQLIQWAKNNLKNKREY